MKVMVLLGSFFLCSLYGYPVLISSVSSTNGEPSADQNDFILTGQNDLVLPGYASKIRGTDFTYDSAIPGLREAMIVRATDGNWSMEWNTAVVPDNPDSRYVSFVWAANVDNVTGSIPMSFYFNENHKIDFYLTDAITWKEESEAGLSLSFRMSERDRHDDYYGFMVLRVPVSEIRAGHPQHLRVIGGKANSNSWYMTMKRSLDREFSINPLPALTRHNGRDMQLLELGLLYLENSAEARLMLGDESHKIQVGFGYNRLRFHIPPVEKDKELDFHLTGAGYEQSGKITVQPVREKEINFVQATHTDIGYTRPQTEILGDHLRFIDYALDYCDQTDHYPEASQFRWVCEVTWPVNEFLRSRPADQVERLKRRIREGRIEVAGMYVNYDELPDEQSLAASMAPLRSIKSHGIEVKTAAQNDVNGIAWCFNDYFTYAGIKYLNMGTHGHRALIAFDRPTAFWWESPSGNRILTFRAEHYHFGNYGLGINSGHFEIFERNLLDYLTELDEKGYPFDVVMIQYSGYQTDNSPPSMMPLEMIRLWNEKYEWPRLRSARFSDFFEKIERSYSEELPVFRAAWPDWWTDGFGSGAREVAAVRQAHVDIIAGQGAAAMAGLLDKNLPEGIGARIDLVNDALLFYGEHTFGADESVMRPFSRATLEMRRLKESYAWEASRRARMIQEEALGLLQDLVSPEDKMSLAVFNTLSWERDGYVTVFLGHDRVLPGSSIQVYDTEGRKLPAQLLRTINSGSYWNIRVNDVPAFGYRKFVIDINADQSGPGAGKSGPGYDKSGPRHGSSTQSGVFENEWYRVEVNTEGGVVTSIWDKDLGKELVDRDAEWGFGQFIYERTANRHEMESYYLENYERHALDSVWFDSYTEEGIWNTIRFRGMTQAADPVDAFSFEIRIFNDEKRIDFSYTINKRSVTDPEAIYVSFPFKVENFEIYSDVPGGTFRAGVEQIPGSSNDWNTVQNFVSVRNGEMHILLGSHETPLMQFGNINTGHYEAGAEPESSHIYGFPMNNYWVTNFNANQYGEFSWSYYFTSGSDTRNSTATKFGWESRMPFLSRIMPPGVPAEEKSPKNSILSGFPDNVLLVNASPAADDNGILLHLRETGGRSVSFIPQSSLKNSLLITETNVLGEPYEKGLLREITLNPYETKLISIILNE